jgi:hypothetical protein
VSDEEDLTFMTSDEVATVGRSKDVNGDLIPYLEPFALFYRLVIKTLVFHLPTLTQIRGRVCVCM